MSGKYVAQLRHRLRHAGFSPLPLVGKRPVLEGWQNRADVTAHEIDQWERTHPAAANTGILTKLVPTLDVDILDEEAVRAIEEHVHEHYDERGYVLPRIGKPPKRAFPFRTDEPFQKILVNVIAPGGGEEKIEFLADGQQVVCFGHPDTHQPYRWHGGELGKIARDDLPYIHENEARQLADDIARILVDRFGYRLKPSATPGNGGDAGPTIGWIPDLIDHGELAAFAMKMLVAGMNDGALINFLREGVRRLEGVDEDRRQRRLEEIRDIVRSARGKLDQKTEARPKQALELIWHGEKDDGALEGKWLVHETLPETGVALMPGQWGTYKTFAALDLSASIMARTDFAGRRVNRQGGVLWLAAEGQNEIKKRCNAVAIDKVAQAECGDGAKRVDPERTPFVHLRRCPALAGDDAKKELRAIIGAAAQGMQEKFGLPLALVVIDAMTSAGQFNDPDATSEASRVMTMLAAIANEFGVLILVIDHFGKSQQTGTRNSSAKEDLADAVLALLGEKDLAGKVTNPRMALRKVRGGPSGEEIPFAPREVVVKPKEGWNAIKTLVIDWGKTDGAREPAAKTKGRSAPWPASLAVFMRAVDNTIGAAPHKISPFADGPEVIAAQLDSVRAEFLKTYTVDKRGDAASDRKAKARAFNRCLSEAINRNLVMTREIGLTETAHIWRL